MDRRIRGRLEMAARAFEFCQAHPNPSTGYTAAVAELAELLARSQQLTDLHREGIAEVRAATAQKRKLRRSIRQAQMKHVGEAAQRAAREVPELAEKLALAREPIPYLAFQSLARTVAAEAEARKDVLVRHGLVDQVLDSLKDRMVQFEQAMQRAAEGRRIHIGAAVELDVNSGEAIGILKVIDGFNRVRFEEDPDLLAAWRSASNVIGPARTGGQSLPREDRGADGRTEIPSGTPPSEGAPKPAA
jgi:hypothetical protein